MYATNNIDPTKPPEATAFLNLAPLCGLCKFKCCVSKSLDVETTEAESAELGLPRRFPIDGGCRCLGESGCTLGDRRPVCCRFAPLQVRSGKLVEAHWFILNCPHKTDYTRLPGDGSGKYRYERRAGISALRQSNSHEILELDYPLEDFPNVLENNFAAVVELFGQAAAEKIRDDLRKRLEMAKGLF